MKHAHDNASGSSPSLERLDELVQSLSIEERARLTSGADVWHASGVNSIGLGPMLTLDGPNGVRGMTFPVGFERHLHSVRHGSRRNLGRGSRRTTSPLGSGPRPSGRTSTTCSGRC